MGTSPIWSSRCCFSAWTEPRIVPAHIMDVHTPCWKSLRYPPRPPKFNFHNLGHEVEGMLLKRLEKHGNHSKHDKRDKCAEEQDKSLCEEQKEVWKPEQNNLNRDDNRRCENHKFNVRYGERENCGTRLPLQPSDGIAIAEFVIDEKVGKTTGKMSSEKSCAEIPTKVNCSSGFKRGTSLSHAYIQQYQDINKLQPIQVATASECLAGIGNDHSLVTNPHASHSANHLSPQPRGDHEDFNPVCASSSIKGDFCLKNMENTPKQEVLRSESTREEKTRSSRVGWRQLSRPEIVKRDQPKNMHNEKATSAKDHFERLCNIQGEDTFREEMSHKGSVVTKPKNYRECSRLCEAAEPTVKCVKLSQSGPKDSCQMEAVNTPMVSCTAGGGSSSSPITQTPSSPFSVSELLKKPDGKAKPPRLPQTLGLQHPPSGPALTPLAGQSPSLMPISPLGLENWCARCRLGFRLTSDLVCHMRAQHKHDRTSGALATTSGEDRTALSRKPERSSAIGRLRCPACGAAFRERHHLSRHLASHAH